MQAPSLALSTATSQDTAPVVPALRFSQVDLTYPDGTVAVRDISLDVASGEFVAIVGPSGCGKSSLLRCASGLIAPTRGSVQVDLSHLGYVFQDSTLLPWRNVQQNVELLAQLRRIPKEERNELARSAIELVGLTGFERHHPRRLSGGMRMRVSLARSLTIDPRVFLFDEPFGALDEITRERLNDELLSVFQSKRFAALFVTHSIYEAVYLATRVVVMSSRPGRIVAEHVVPFSYPRTPEVRFSAEFSRVAGQISSDLREAIA
ncbi:MAG: ABC transporter ATP-binding protein [Ferrimicrobium sp.]|jgi:NitT/TauT family transport system ATP-binding protein|uniref:ABC transporter ATP-binding protein n=1 Tax=Ferrimicrobium acidiphilum TaxID=121039 RepID=A0ABV3Y1R9_9ACTN|nr:ABC transporter ATP-binding protein [Ferrimicrobium sp.]